MRKRILAAALAALMLAGCGNTAEDIGHDEAVPSGTARESAESVSVNDAVSEAGSAETSPENGNEDNAEAREAVRQFMECVSRGDREGVLSACCGALHEVMQAYTSEDGSKSEGESYDPEFTEVRDGKYRYSCGEPDILYEVTEFGGEYKVSDMIFLLDTGEVSWCEHYASGNMETLAMAFALALAANSKDIEDGVYSKGENVYFDGALDDLADKEYRDRELLKPDMFEYTVTVEGGKLTAANIEYTLGGRSFTWGNEDIGSDE